MTVLGQLTGWIVRSVKTPLSMKRNKINKKSSEHYPNLGYQRDNAFLKSHFVSPGFIQVISYHGTLIGRQMFSSIITRQEVMRTNSCRFCI